MRKKARLIMMYIGWFLLGLVLGGLVGGVAVLLIFDLDQDIDIK